jgi:hypothetical protein
LRRRSVKQILEKTPSERMLMCFRCPVCLLDVAANSLGDEALDFAETLAWFRPCGRL